MRSARLDMALRAGVFSLPSTGGILVFGAALTDDLSPLPPQACTIIAGFKPDHDHFAAKGYRVLAEWSNAPACDLVIICIPRAKLAAKDAVAQGLQHLRAGGKIVLDGQKTDGIGAILKDLSDLGWQPSDVISKAHGKLAAFEPQALPPGWAATPKQVEGGFVTRAGTFSAEGPDRASDLLAQILPARLPPRMADLGAGWGFLSRAILARTGVACLDMVEADHAALTCARQNIQDPRAQYHWADAATFKPSLPWDAVVMNPPFHTQRSPDAGLGLAFIRNAHARLASNGQLWLVANRQLPYTATVRTLFRDVEEIGTDASFRLIRAAGPLRAPKG